MEEERGGGEVEEERGVGGERRRGEKEGRGGEGRRGSRGEGRGGGKSYRRVQNFRGAQFSRIDVFKIFRGNNFRGPRIYM